MDGSHTRSGVAAAVLVLGLVLVAPLAVACDAAPSDAVPSGVDGGDAPGAGGSGGTGTPPGGTHDVDALVAQLAAGTRSERADAAAALGALGDPTAVPALVEALGDESWEVRAAVAAAFIDLPDPRAVGPLLDLLAVEPAPPAVREDELAIARDACRNAMDALGRIGDPAAAARLVAIATDEAIGLDTGTAAAALEAIGEAAIPALVDAVGSGSAARGAAAVGLLARLGEPALGALVAALDDGRPGVRVAAAEALGGFGRDAVKPLVSVLDEPGDALRAAAARSLGEIGDARATDALVDLLADPDVRRVAVGALVAIHRDDASELVPYLRHRATVAVYRPLIRLVQGDTVAALVTALDRYGTKTMGETYLNCGEPRLEKAAQRWARAHGYIVVPGMGSGEEVWGGS